MPVELVSHIAAGTAQTGDLGGALANVAAPGRLEMLSQGRFIAWAWSTWVLLRPFRRCGRSRFVPALTSNG